MKKILSILLAVIIMATSCACALTVFAADDCSKGHTVTKWYNNSKNNHLGYCDECGATVKKAHELQKIGESEKATCLKDGYTRYECAYCSYAVSADTVTRLGHDIVSVTYDYDENNDGKFDDLDVYYEKTIDCRNEGCDFVTEKGTIGASNYCPGCEKHTLLKKTIVSATCQSVSYTIYYCSNPECESEFRINAENLADHRYTSKPTAPTCTEEGYTEYTCIFCGGSYQDEFIPAKGHTMNAPGGVYDYVYNVEGVDKCQITGTCADCGKSVVEVKNNTPAEKCDGCDKGISSKRITMPVSCEDSAQIEINCATCGTYNVTALPVGHSIKTATYLYNDDGTVDVTVECYDCNVTTTEETEYLDDQNCVKCSTKIQKRVVVSPTCSTNGYVKVTCPECGIYTESAKSSLSHAATFAEWSFDRSAGILTFKADCQRDGCDGHTYKAAIGTSGKCGRCGRDALLSKKVMYSTCTSEGYTEANCSYCGLLNNYDPKDILPHNDISSEIKATCTIGGCVKNTCKNCLYTTETKKTDPLGHTGGVTALRYNSSTGKKTTEGYCDRCSEFYKKESSIQYGENICTKCGGATIMSKAIVKPDCGSGTNGYTVINCEKCVSYETDIITAKHNYGAWVTTLEPTCVEAGQQERVCAICDSIQIDIIPANQTSDGRPKHQYVLMVKGYPATCTEDGLSDEMYCASCGEYKKSEVIPATGHAKDPDSMNPDFCSRCNSYVIGEGDTSIPCDCICHNRDGLAAFFFKILLFFCQILNINQKCDCGRVHY